jgi:hypothetical protein
MSTLQRHIIFTHDTHTYYTHTHTHTRQHIFLYLRKALSFALGYVLPLSPPQASGGPDSVGAERLGGFGWLGRFYILGFGVGLWGATGSPGPQLSFSSRRPLFFL